MREQVSTAKWIGMFLLQVPLYVFTSYIIRQLLGSAYGVIVKAGANLSPNLLRQHFLIVGLLGGFLAGMVGVLVLRATLLLPTRFEAVNGPAWKRPQAWTWVIGTVWFAVGIVIWIVANSNHSVLSASSGLDLPDIISVFFGRECDLSAAKLDRSVFDACLLQLSCTHPWLGTIGYSAAAFVPVGWTKGLKNSLDAPEKAHASSVEQGEEQQSRSGEVLN